MVVNIDTENVSLKKEKKKKKKQREEEKLEVSTGEEAINKEEKKKNKKKKDKKRDSESTQELKDKKKKKKSNKRKREHDDEEGEDSPAKKKAKKKEDEEKQEVAAVSTPTSSRSKLSSAQIQEYRDTNRIIVDSSVEIVPYITFDQVQENFDPELVQACCAGFEKPSPIQSHCWPVAKSGKYVFQIDAVVAQRINNKCQLIKGIWWELPKPVQERL